MRTKIVAQSPPGCIVATTFGPHLKPPLVDFDIIQEYIIPRKAFFNRFLTVNTPDNKYSILGYPVSIPHERYHRNEFIFNFGLVVESDCDFCPTRSSSAASPSPSPRWSARTATSAPRARSTTGGGRLRACWRLSRRTSTTTASA
ncbi:nitrogen permease regulator 2 [Apiospora hydei]|uniref:Nitrogen permease regulator 2 n=1 Tax=Apiospora hydei TaxID=1337664 RepID=A0ABR1VX80_9PEZI